MIDWNEQWELHAPNFSEGFAHVSLKEYGGPDQTFKMAPGPGFGDLSHPTTQLMLTLMPPKTPQPVIDIGCGSGVLSLAAKQSGASCVYGIDIDPGAIAHAQLNAQLNDLDCTFSKALLHCPKAPLILMNMISSEQKKAWAALPPFKGATMIVSGYTEDEPPPSYGLLLKSLTLDGWAAYVMAPVGN